MGRLIKDSFIEEKGMELEHIQAKWGNWFMRSIGKKMSTKGIKKTEINIMNLPEILIFNFLCLDIVIPLTYKYY